MHPQQQPQATIQCKAQINPGLNPTNPKTKTQYSKNNKNKQEEIEEAEEAAAISSTTKAKLN